MFDIHLHKEIMGFLLLIQLQCTLNSKYQLLLKQDETDMSKIIIYLYIDHISKLFQEHDKTYFENMEVVRNFKKSNHQ